MIRSGQFKSFDDARAKTINKSIIRIKDTYPAAMPSGSAGLVPADQTAGADPWATIDMLLSSFVVSSHRQTLTA